MNRIANLLRRGVACLASVPCVFDCLRWFLEGGFRNHRKLLARHFSSSPDSVLDCGCGTGILAHCFRPENYVGIDLSRGYIERARSLYPAYDFRVMDATSLEFRDSSFEAVLVSGVLHHLDDNDARSVLKELQRVLKPGGTLLLWEDVPTRSCCNIIGHVIHRLDVGEHIRAESAYIDLLEPYFSVTGSETLLSGCMDYIVFKASPKETAAESGSHPLVGGSPSGEVPAGWMPSAALVRS